MQEKKQQLRGKLSQLRLDYNSDELVKFSQIIWQNTLAVVVWKDVHSLYIYTPHSSKNEFFTDGFLSELQRTFGHVFVTTSPALASAPIPTEQYDVIIIPCLGASKDGYRLGNGGGWYDKFLAGQQQAIKIGWCLDGCIISDFPAEPHDQKMNLIISEKETITTG